MIYTCVDRIMGQQDQRFLGRMLEEMSSYLSMHILLSNYIDKLFASFSIVEIVTSSPPGMQITSLRDHGGIYYRNVTWYPSQYQVGQQVFCFKAVDSRG